MSSDVIATERISQFDDPVCAIVFQADLADSFSAGCRCNSSTRETGCVAKTGGDLVKVAKVPIDARPTHPVHEHLAPLQSVNQMLLQAGAKRYLSGWLGSMDSTYWHTHYGERYDAWVSVKRKYDPQGILGSPLLSFPR